MRRDCRSNTWISAAASACRTTAATCRRPPTTSAALVGEIRRTGLPIVVEPGRAIAASAGVLLARVIDLKPRTADSDFVDHRRRHDRADASGALRRVSRIEPIAAADAGDHHYEIVGPVCESSDVVGRDRMLPTLAVGDLVAIRDAGAYGCGDGVELQSASAAAGSAGRRRRLARHPPTADGGRSAGAGDVTGRRRTWNRERL